MLQRATNRLRIQYASDLHLEFFRSPPAFQTLLKPVAPLLALAGDIGYPHSPVYRDFLHYCSEQWESVFIVAGNHELYNTNGTQYSSIEQIQQCEEVAYRFPNVHFLHRGRVELPTYGVTVLGTTLWTDLGSPYRQEVAKDTVSDYRYITVQEGEKLRPLEPLDTHRWHQEDMDWLQHEIQENATIGRPAIVITHHLPIYGLIATRYQHSPVNFCFASDCRNLLRDPVRAWLCGHTHTAVNYTAETRRGHILMGVNPRGYPNEVNRTGYCAEIFMDISTEPIPVDERDPLLIKSGLYDHPTADVGRLGEESSYELGSQTPARRSQSSVTDETQSGVSFE